jgi:hypothetical protein
VDIFWNRAGTVCKKAYVTEIDCSNAGATSEQTCGLTKGSMSRWKLLFEANDSNVYRQNSAAGRTGNTPTTSDKVKEKRLLDNERNISGSVNSEGVRLNLQHDDAGRQ